jgi:hypothetical protein
LILSQQDRENFSRLIAALGPWLNHMVVVGGWAHRLYRLHPAAQQLDYPPVVTLDADVALPLRLPAIEPDLRERLLAHGFQEELMGHHHPPVTHYQLGPTSGGLYVEFLTPLIGSGYKRNRKPNSTMRVAGVVSQNLRYLELLLRSPWSVNINKTGEFPQTHRLKIQVANPAAFVAQKLLVNARRPPADRAKDILYIHDTIETFGNSLEQIRAEWQDNVRNHLHVNAIRTLNRAIKSLFREVNDVTREAALMAIGRKLLPPEITNVCQLGLSRIFD